jgi:phosphate-selective porin OprO/OprP
MNGREGSGLENAALRLVTGNCGRAGFDPPGGRTLSAAARGGTVFVAVILIILIVIRAAAADQSADVATAPDNARVSEPPHGVTWRWSWDRGVRYDVQVPFDEYWIGPDRGPLMDRPIEKRLALIGKIGGIMQVDAAGYGETRGLDGANGGTELRRVRFGTRGDFFLLGHASYAVDLELVSSNLQLGDFYLWWSQIPIVRSFKIGNFTPPLSLESVTAARDTVFMETGLPVQAFAPGRSFGIQVGGPEWDQRLTWALGVFRTVGTPTVGDQSKDGERTIGRVTWLPEDTPTSRRLTHVGLSGSLLFGAGDVRYQSSPESHQAPTFVDTGTLRSAGNSIVSGFELAHFRGPWLFMNEILVANVRGQDTATLWGTYASLSRFLSDDAQPYDRTSGRLARFEPPRPFSWSARTYGAVRAAARVSHLDLSEGAVNGGRETNLTADLTWFLNHYLSLDLEYGFAAIRDRPNQGNLHFVQTRFQFDCF